MNSKTKSSPIDRPPVPLTNRSIWILGPRRLQNELLADLLARRTGAKCSCGESASQVTAGGGEGLQTGLLLFDCLGQDLEACLERIGLEVQKAVPSHLVALFNIAQGLGIEERALREGVRGFFYEKDPPELLQKGVRAIFAGELWASREIMSKCILEVRGNVKTYSKDAQVLTNREMEILSLIAIGASNEEIGAKLCISVNTVKTHVYNIFHKINVPNRLQAALWAAKHL